MESDFSCRMPVADHTALGSRAAEVLDGFPRGANPWSAGKADQADLCDWEEEVPPIVYLSGAHAAQGQGPHGAALLEVLSPLSRA